MVLEGLKHFTVLLLEYLVTMRRLLQDTKCKDQGFAPKQFKMTLEKGALLFEV
jgi:hypothetical protein